MHGRIWFLNNPWPEGHSIAEFTFQILLDEGGPRLLLHLVTEDYGLHGDTDSEEEEDVESDWLSKDVWTNYHRCILSNIYWGPDRKSAPPLETPVHARPDTFSLHVDPVAYGAEMPRSRDVCAFHIYLLGHDSVGGHEIQIVRDVWGLYNISWFGLVALTYAGESTFLHRFRAEVHAVEFGGFRLENPPPSANVRAFVHPKPRPPEFAAREARARRLAAQMISGAEALDFHVGKGFDPDFLKPSKPTESLLKQCPPG